MTKRKKDKMTAKEYLKQSLHLEMDKKALELEREQVISSLLGATNYDDIGGSGGERKLPEDKYLIIITYSEAIDKKLFEMWELRLKLSEEINQMTDRKLASILRYRYILGLEFTEIADKLHYTERHVKRLHGQALIEFEEVMKDVL